MKIKNTEIKVTQGDIARLHVDVVASFNFKTEENEVRIFVKSALEDAEKLKINSIAFHALGRGTGDFSYLAAAKIMAQEILKHLRQKSSLKEIIFCLNEKEVYEIFNKGVLNYLKHITEELQSGPFVTVDVIIEIDDGIVIIKRSNPPFGWALPGGFVDYGESLEDAVIREAKEETNLELLRLRQFHTYSDPNRDSRFHTISTVFIAKGKGAPCAGDDATGIKVLKLSDIENLQLAFDHKKVIKDYILSLPTS